MDIPYTHHNLHSRNLLKMRAKTQQQRYLRYRSDRGTKTLSPLI